MERLKETFILKLLTFLTRRQKVAFAGLLVLFLFSAILNVFAYTLLAPLVGIASGVNEELQDRLSYHLSPWIGSSHLLIKFTLIVLVFQGFRIGFRLLNSLLSTFFIRRILYRLASNVLRSNMNLSYVDYQNKDYHLVSRDLTFVSRYGKLLTDIMEIFANFILLTGYVFTLFYLSWKITGLIFLYFMGVFLLFGFVFKHYIRTYGRQANEFETQQDRAATLLLRNFKFIKTRGENIEVLQKQYLENGSRSFIRRSLLQIFQLLNGSFIELSGIFVLIGLIIYFHSSAGGIAFELSRLSLYAISFYRIVPILSEMTKRYHIVLEQHDTVNVLLASLAQKQENVNYKGDPLPFKDKIVFDRVCYAYERDKPVLRDISFTIHCGDRIGIMGESGTGKTTLGDILIGLLCPCSGSITVDGVLLTPENWGRWRKSIGYIPQNIFLFDGTVEENVTFDRPADEEKLIATLKKARIWDFLQEKAGIKTRLSLDGSSLSGGQRQRLGIARTFYMDPDLIVLDEATSALDTQTETEIMREIYELKKGTTLLIIAHRLSTLNECDKIIHMEGGYIKMIENREILL